MATTRRAYVFATFLSSCAALVLLIVACATNVWITSDLRPMSSDLNLPGNKANYGLFSGTFIKRNTLTNRFIMDIKIVCDFGENVCAWSCMGNSAERRDELATLIANNVHNPNCPSKSEIVSATEPLSPVKNDVRVQGSARIESKDRFLNAGLWLSTLLMMALALLASVVAALLAVVNTAANPRSSWLAVPGLYCSNAVAAAFELLTLVLWGAHFAVRITQSVAVNEVISQRYESEGLARLGWSYWLVLVALVINVANICVLVWRDYLIKREPPPPTYNPEKEVADGTLFMY